MVNQQIFLPMIPDSAPIVINISQYDFDAAGYAGRLFFNLVSKGATYDMDGASAIFQGEKPDGTMFAYPATVVNASVVRVNVRQQMTAVSGRVVCQLVLSNQDGQIGSFNIWLEVQPSSGSGSDPSQTDIPALIAQAKEYADIAEQAAIDVEAYSANPPYIGANGNWYVYDAVNEVFIDTGVYAAGTEGSLWYDGTACAGKSSTPTVYPTGITLARERDMYLNKSEGAIYKCTLGGADTVAQWVYVMTLAGGGGGVSDYDDLGNKPQINGNNLVGGNQTGHDLGLQNELTEGNGIAIDPITLEISADLLAGSNISIVPINGKLKISSTGGGGGGGDTVSWTQIQGSSGATKIAEIDINGTSQDVYAPSGGGGSSLQIIPDPAGTPTPDEAAVVNAINGAIIEGGTNDDVISAFGVGKWSNLDGFKVLSGALSTGTDTIGTWEDDATWPTGSRVDWIWHSALYNILGDNDYDIEPIFELVSGKQTAIACLTYRFDDNVDQIIDGVTVHGGAFAIKLSAPIPAEQNNVKVGLMIKHNRTKTFNGKVITS